MTTAKQFFERVRDASRDAERIRTQLVAMEHRAQSLGGGGFEPRVRSTPDPQRMERRVDVYMDRENALKDRMEDDYRLIDKGCMVIYGNDEHRGLDKVVSPVWADVLWWKYLDDAKMVSVADVVGYSMRTCSSMCAQALAWIDEHRFMSAVIDSIDEG